MIRILGILFSAFEAAGFGVFCYLAHATHTGFGWLLFCYSMAVFSLGGFVLRLRERTLLEELCEAEEKLCKRVLRRVPFVVPWADVQALSQTASALERALPQLVEEAARRAALLVKPPGPKVEYIDEMTGCASSSKE